PVDFAVLEGLGREEAGAILAEGLARGGRLIPKRLLTILVPDHAVEKVVSTIIRVNQSGNKGDGKIFIAPLADACRIRTGERGEAAI
ncbi:MAG: P-II family nitrogen regulator, partial [Bacillota bacterium]